MKENKKKSSCLLIIEWAVLIMLISVVGRSMGRMAGFYSFEKNEHRSTLYNNHFETINPDKELSYALSNTKKKLTVVIEAHTTWPDTILTSNALEHVYLMDDSSFDIHKFDLNAYREHILKNFPVVKSCLD